MKIITKILGLTIAHFGAGAFFFLISFSRTMDRFDDGGEPTLIDAFSGAAVNILWTPFLPLARALGVQHGPAEWLLLGANSLLWGFALYLSVEEFWRWFTSPSSPSQR